MQRFPRAFSKTNNVQKARALANFAIHQNVNSTNMHAFISVAYTIIMVYEVRNFTGDTKMSKEYGFERACMHYLLKKQ